MKNGAFEFVEDDGTIPHSQLQKIGWAHKHVWDDENMTLIEKRARLVGRGYRQVAGRDFDPAFGTYSATPRQCAVRTFACAVNANDFEDRHVDVKKAFTQNMLDKVLYSPQPVGLKPVLGKNGKPMLLKLIMALEGLKQSGHLHMVNHSGTFASRRSRGRRRSLAHLKVSSITFLLCMSTEG